MEKKEKKFLSQDGLLYLWTLLKGKLVAKEDGKGLSTNDYTTEDKTKLTGIEAGAEKNKIQAVSLNGTTLTPNETTRTVEITMPTKVSALTNDAGYQTADQVEATVTGKGYQTAENVESAITAKGYQTASQVESTVAGKGYQTASDVQTAINSSIAQITGVDFKIVDSLPENGVAGTFYLVSNGGTSGNAYDEYVWITKADKSKGFEKIGTTDVDLSQYVKASEIVDISNEEIDAIIASA